MNRTELTAKAMFLEKLGYLLDAGLPLTRALMIVEAETSEPRCRRAAGRIRAAISQHGEYFDLSSCLEPGDLSESEKAILLATASSGRLDRGCLLVVKWLDREIAELPRS